MMQRALLALDRAIEALACIILIALLLCVTLGVVTRALDDPLIWTDEISRFLMVWLAVFGWILATQGQKLLPGHLAPAAGQPAGRPLGTGPASAALR